MGGGSPRPRPRPSPAGSPRGDNIEGDLTHALNNCRIEPADPGSSGGAAAMPTCFGGFPPSSGSPCHHHHKHKLKSNLKMIKHMRHHGFSKIKHRHHEHSKIKHRNHMQRHRGEKEKHMFPHCCHPMNAEAHLGCGFHHNGGPPPHHHGHRHGHHMRQRRHGHCGSHGYHHFFTAPMAVPVPAPPQG